MFQLSSYSKSDLTEALKGLKSYRAFYKQIGKRGPELFQVSLSGKISYRAEVFGDDHASVASLVVSAFKSHFGVDVAESEITWKRNDSIKGGVRIFVGDDMVDMSFAEIERRIVA